MNNPRVEGLTRLWAYGICRSLAGGFIRTTAVAVKGVEYVDA
jgi:hypothetical protein